MKENTGKIYCLTDEQIESLKDEARVDALAEFKDLGKLYSEIRAEAIDECKQILLDAIARDGKTKCHEYMIAINEMEKLKEQNNLTCFDCEHHFMSDCYLECNKHNRINDKKICDDFEQLKEQK